MIHTGGNLTQLSGYSLGQFHILEQIGQGGMARVYKAYQPSLDRFVAIKVIAAQLDNARDNEFLARFTSEARLIARLTHPNIVPVHDFGEESGWAFIVMEYIEDGTVRDRLVSPDGRSLRLNLAHALDLINQAALALDLAHSRGVVHRDVKPANMLLRTEEQLLLSDFGIATILEANRAFTRSGSNIGTPQYMAPEQATPGGVVDGRTDIYALGVVLFQCVTGRLPFTAARPMDVLHLHLNEPIPSPAALVADLPQPVEHIILHAMEKDPANRYAYARDMAADIQRARAELGSFSPRLYRATARMEAVGVVPIPLASPRIIPAGPARQEQPAGNGTTCFRCAAPIDAHNRFCTMCGYDLSGRRADADRFLLPNGRPLRCRVLLRKGPLVGQAFTLHQDVTTIGRTASNDIVLPDLKVSRSHARLSFHNGQWFLEDLNSRNGTFVKGIRISRPAPLVSGDEIKLGDEVMLFELVA
jgi:tRNA A-37 threonylcarbamoyl transferase component Bud32